MLSKSIIEELKDGAKQLINQTKSSDLLIFIGQSPVLLIPYVENDRECISIPFSGRVFQDQYCIPTKSQIDNYASLLNELGINRKIIEQRKIILVDHSHTGHSIVLFVKTLIRCLDFVDRYDRTPLYLYDEQLNNGRETKISYLEENPKYSFPIFSFINMVSPKQLECCCIKKPRPQFVNTVGYIIMKNTVAFANEGIPDGEHEKIARTIPNYPVWKWNKAPQKSA